MLQLFLSSLCLPVLVHSTHDQYSHRSAVQPSEADTSIARTHTLTYLDMSISSSPSSRSSSEGWGNSNGSTPTSLGTLSGSGSIDDDAGYKEDGLSSGEMKNERQPFLSYISSSASKNETPRYPTCPLIADIAPHYAVETIHPQSTLYEKPRSIFTDLHAPKFDWDVDLTLYKHSLNPIKIGAHTTHLGVNVSQKDRLAGLRTIDDSTYFSAKGFAARIDGVHQDLVNTLNPSGNDTEIDKVELKEAETRLTQLYQPLGGTHTVHDFGSLVSTFEAKSQQYIRELRIKKGLLPEFREPRRMGYLWVGRDAPRDRPDGEEGGGQGL